MVPLDDKQKFLDELENLPITSVVCKRAGISKATIYRWIEDDADFKKKYDRALKRGRETLVDHAESKLVKLVDKEHFGAIKYLLDANSKRYYKPRKPAPAPQEERIIRAIQMSVIKEEIDFKEALRRRDEEKIKRANRRPPEGLWDELPP